MEPKNFPFPMLSEMSIDYQQGAEYKAKIRQTSNSNIVVSHKLTNNNIVAKFVAAKKAKFGCVVSLPATLFRKVFICESDGLSAVQEIDYKFAGGSENVESPKFLPVIIKVGEDNINSPLEESGLGDLWQDGNVNFPDGSIIGSAGWMQYGGATKSILQIIVDEKLSPGQIRVETNFEGGFRFLAHVDQSFHDFLRYPGDANPRDLQSVENHARSVQVQMFSRALEMLHADAKSESYNWEEYPNLKLLAGMLDDEDQPHWTHEHFCADEVATALRPHWFRKESEEYE